MIRVVLFSIALAVSAVSVSYTQQQEDEAVNKERIRLSKMIDLAAKEVSISRRRITNSNQFIAKALAELGNLNAAKILSNKNPLDLETELDQRVGGPINPSIPVIDETTPSSPTFDSNDPWTKVVEGNVVSSSTATQYSLNEQPEQSAPTQEDIADVLDHDKVEKEQLDKESADVDQAALLQTEQADAEAKALLPKVAMAPKHVQSALDAFASL